MFKERTPWYQQNMHHPHDDQTEEASDCHSHQTRHDGESQVYSSQQEASFQFVQLSFKFQWCWEVDGRLLYNSRTIKP